MLLASLLGIVRRGSVRRSSIVAGVNFVRRSTDRLANVGAQRKCSSTDADTDDGEDQRIFGRRSAGFVTDKALQEIDHDSYPKLLASLLLHSFAN